MSTTYQRTGRAADALRQRIEREKGWACQLPCYTETVTLV